MSNPWDRPSSGSPFRTGDLDEDRLYLAVGRCLSKWERLEGAITHLYAAVVGAEDCAPAIRAFGTLNSPSARAEMISAAADATFHYFGFQAGIDPVPAEIEEGKEIEDELRDVLKHYRGWMSRRNDVAHGYVNTRTHPDSTQDGEPKIASSLMYPSDGSSGKWCLVLGEPAYAYEAKDIDSFGVAFDNLENRVTTLVTRVTAYRQTLRR